MGRQMAGTNKFAFFRCRSIRTGGGVQNDAEKQNSENAFRPVLVRKSASIFPVLNLEPKCPDDSCGGVKAIASQGEPL